MNQFESVKQQLMENPKQWLITGVAGFIGSNLIETLLSYNQKVTGLDNFSTGYQKNLDLVKSAVSKDQWAAFDLMEGDIRDLETCQKACSGSDYILHQAALGSVPRSINDPVTTNENNIDGFLNMLVAARDSGAEKIVYAASSSTYGDHPGLPKQEDVIGKPLSPYAVTKYVNELYADVFAKTYGLKSIGLRYFNVFGQRQDPNGAYAAVIPKWFSALLKGTDLFINGDGETSRDFCFIENCVQANILSATTENEKAFNQVFNVACGQRTSLNELFEIIKGTINHLDERIQNARPIYREFRAGDVRHSLADIEKAKSLLGYEPAFSIKEGMEKAADWYVKHLGNKRQEIK